MARAHPEAPAQMHGEGLRTRLPRIHTWLWVDDGSGPCPEWAEAYEALAGSGEPAPAVARDGDDLLLLYTGGTTGIPKGVMWRQDDLLQIYNRARLPAPYDLSRGLAGVEEQKRAEGPGRVVLPASPLMHGTGLLTGLLTLVSGGSVVTLTSRRFDPVEMLDAIERFRVEGTAIVGDAFAPDARFGEAITALVEPADGRSPAEAELVAWVKQRLAHYKAPKRVLLVETIGRSPSGKVDYQAAKRVAASRLEAH